MELKKITAIVRSSKLESVENQLHLRGIKGISVTSVKGYGENKNFFSHDWKVTHAKIEIFCQASQVDAIVDMILTASSTNSSGDGIIAILPVEKIIKVRTGSEWADAKKPV